MVVSFTPVGNATNVCQGIEARNAIRPPNSNSTITATLVVFILHCFASLILLIMLYHYKDATRFKKIRPFFVNAILLIGFTLISITVLLNNDFNIPCGLMMVFLLGGLSTFAVNFFAKAMIFTVEGQFAILSEKFKLHFEEDVILQGSLTNWELFTGLFRLLSGLSQKDELNLPLLQGARNSFGVIVVFCSLPAFIPFISILVTVPQYQVCWACEINLEVILAYLFELICYCSLALFVLWKARALPDKYGVKVELGVQVTLGGGIAFTSALLMIFEPNTGFQYQWILMFAGWAFVYIGIPWQLWLVFERQQKHKVVVSVQVVSSYRVSSQSRSALWSQIQNDSQRMARFEKFLSDHLAVENLHFVQDCETFKGMFFDKSEKWRISKVRLLIHTYVEVGSLMEVNLSNKTKDAIISANSSEASSKLFEIFDIAIDDTLTNIIRPWWNDFLKEEELAVKLSVTTS